jgi:hypothetical protein
MSWNFVRGALLARLLVVLPFSFFAVDLADSTAIAGGFAAGILPVHGSLVKLLFIFLLMFLFVQLIRG